MIKKYLFMAALAFMLVPLAAQEMVDEDVNAVIRKHGLDNSEVMDIASWIIDTYGPRLTGSPGLDEATDWVVNELKSWGMQNVHLEAWGPFGRGWDGCQDGAIVGNRDVLCSDPAQFFDQKVQHVELPRGAGLGLAVFVALAVDGTVADEALFQFAVEVCAHDRSLKRSGLV